MESRFAVIPLRYKTCSSPRTLILMRANAQNAQCLQNILNNYCTASGQLVGEAKSSTYFSPNTEITEKANVCQILNILTESLSDKYLGLPSMIGVDRTDCFMHLVERNCRIVNGWKEKTLSMGGKEVLLKAVAQAIRTYAMPVFRLPKKIRGNHCHDS